VSERSSQAHGYGYIWVVAMAWLPWYGGHAVDRVVERATPTDGTTARIT